MKYQPDRYVCKITTRKDNYLMTRRMWEAPLFDSWAEAHAWLVEDRAQQVGAAETKLRIAQAALKRAAAMEPK